MPKAIYNAAPLPDTLCPCHSAESLVRLATSGKPGWGEHCIPQQPRRVFAGYMNRGRYDRDLRGCGIFRKVTRNETRDQPSQTRHQKSRTAQLADRDPKAFWSYNRFDDQHARGKLTELRTRLENELHARLGTPFTIFQDTIDLTWGAQWQQRLLNSIDEAIFFIPLISPKYFGSPVCMTELDTFLQREQEILYEELILPVYWIDLISTNRPNDDLVSTIMSRNFVDFRELRLTPIDDSAIDEKIAEIASKLIQRLNEFNDHQRHTTNMKATITTPERHARVARNITVTGTTDSIPRGITPWLVVEAGGRYHPQTAIPITSRDWTTTTTIGTAEFGARKRDCPIYIIATTKTANEKFTNYRAEQQKLQAWGGLRLLPAGTKILATTTVRRDDHASALAKLIGTYDEYRAKPPQPTKGTITIKGTPYGDLTITATSNAGDTVWTGTITVDPTTGQATADYQGTKATGQGTLELEQTEDEVAVTGKDNTAPTKPFHMIWKKRPT